MTLEAAGLLEALILVLMRVPEGALALGCIGAAAAGQVEFGIPCVVGGAVSSAGLHYWDTQN